LEISPENATEPIRISEGLGSCDNFTNRYLEWNGKWFDLKRAEIDFSGGARDLFNCGGYIRSFSEKLPPPLAAEILDASLNAYLTRSQNQDEPLEEFHVLKGLYTAYAGNQEDAREIFKEVVDSPFIKDSIWSAPAKDFLDTYNAPADLYRACLKLIGHSKYYTQFVYPPKDFVDVDLCDKKLAFQYTISTAFANTSIKEIPDSLRKAGIPVIKSGEYDFDGDDELEAWLTIVQPGETDTQLWMVAKYSQGLKAMWIANIPGIPEFSPAQTDSMKSVTLLNTNQTFTLIRHPVSGEPTLSIGEAPGNDPAQQNFAKFLQIRQKLFSNVEPVPTYNQMLELDQKYPNCPFKDTDTDGETYYACDAFYYTLALAAELAGKEDDAVQRYYDVWNDYPNSPFATLAQLRLNEKD
jgi:hypothetical protein